MKAKLVICLFLIAALLLVLPACIEEDVPDGTGGINSSTGPLDEVPYHGFSKNKYEIYYRREGSEVGYFSADAVHISELYPDTTAPEPAEQTLTVHINSVDYELQYDRTIELPGKAYRHIYESSDKKVLCQYWAEDMKLAQVGIDLALADFAGMDQSQYEQWIQTFVAQFTQEDFSKLQLACQTQYNRLEDGFFTEPKGEETIQGYSFRYEKYIDSVKTMDAVSASFDIKAEDAVMRVTVAFNDHEFDAFDALKVDYETIDQVISDYMTAYMGENIKLVNYETQGADELSVIDGNVMLTRTLHIEYKWKGLKKESVVELTIDIPDP